ncbi:MAG: DUF2851 family protein [Ekhidna sp.]|nr:DUF2851 family protein [Ekhidna sp.]
MDEQFLHYIWKYQKFDQTDLSLTDRRVLTVFNIGIHNHDSGPDFEEARIKIEDIQWAGHVEIHINSSDWNKHKHQKDPAYQNVVLHVVWNHDTEILIENTAIPTLELKEIVDLSVLKKYKSFKKESKQIPCANSVAQVQSMTITSMLNRTLVERLEQKGAQVLQMLIESGNDWEETTYRLFLLNFGFSVNKEAFQRLGQTLPFREIKKLLQNLQQTEAVLFGQSGFLREGSEGYQKALQKEHQYLAKKHSLKNPISIQEWKFGKMRPTNFPTVRLAQLAAILHNNPKLFSTLIETEDIKELKNKLAVDVSDYWQRHYDFSKERSRKGSKIGNQSFENIQINTIAPLLAAYSKYIGSQKYMDRAIQLLDSLMPEKNRVTKKWDSLKLYPANAFESQALIQLYQSYCQPKRCLSCNIGVAILNK